MFSSQGNFFEFGQAEIEQSIPERFEKMVARYPERIAVKTPNHSLTYDELNKAANRVARSILALIGEAEEPVALLVQHGPFVIVGILAILKAGKTYVSLHPALPDARAAQMLEDSQAKLLLTDTTHLSRAQELVSGKQKVLKCDDVDGSVPNENLNRSLSPEMSALILYTSGSTGLPKGVLLNHRHILVEIRTYTNDVRICSEDRLALCQSCSFALSLRNLYGALLNGATLFPYDLAREGVASLAGWIEAHRITILHLPATAFRGFLEDVEPNVMFSELRVLRLGAEPINSEDIKLFRRHFSPDCVLLHAIGARGLSRVKSGVDEYCGLTFVEKVKSELGFKAAHREVKEVTGTYTLREQSEAYGANFAGETEALRPEDTISWQETDETTET